MVAIIVQVEHADSRSSRWREPHDSNTFRIPCEMSRPQVLARVEDGHYFTCSRIASFKAIASTLIAVSASECQIVCIVRAAGRLGQHVVEGKANKLPSFVGMAIFTMEIRSLPNCTPS
jgi:hypothetical protein